MAKVIDMKIVRSAQHNLARIAAEHPELLGESSVEGWAETLSEMEERDMKTVQLGIRFSPEVVAAVDRFAAEENVRLRETLPGVTLNRADAIRVLVVAALQVRGYEPGSSSEPTVKPRKPRRK